MQWKGQLEDNEDVSALTHCVARVKILTEVLVRYLLHNMLNVSETKEPLNLLRKPME